MDRNENKTKGYLITGILLVVFVLSLFIGKYPLLLSDLLKQNEIALRVFYTLRLPRVLMACLTGCVLGVAGFIYQSVFHNPLASPDFIGVSSGASAGAAFAILFLPSSLFLVSGCAFVGGVIAIALALTLAYFSKNKNNISILLSGLAVQSLAQTILMYLKLSADPEKELASIEYWIMGSFNAVTLKQIIVPLGISIVCIALLFLLYRQVQLLSLEEEEAIMLGMSVTTIRICILVLATLMVASAVSVCGIISFVGLLAPHCARFLYKNNRSMTMYSSGCIGAIILCIADILARCGTSELPVSIFTSLIGAPFLLYLLLKKEGKHEI